MPVAGRLLACALVLAAATTVPTGAQASARAAGCAVATGAHPQSKDPVRAGVVGYRVVRRIGLDHGTFVAVPAAADSCPTLAPEDALLILRSMETVDTGTPAGHLRSEVFGYGIVTVKVPNDPRHRGLEHFTKRPAYFLATAFNGVYACPAQRGPAPKTTPAQRGYGYHIEVLDAAGRDAIGYTEAGVTPCSGKLHGPGYDPGYQVLSAPWTADASARVLVQVPRCGRITGTSESGGGGRPYELAVYVEQLVGTHHPGCSGPRTARVKYYAKYGVPTVHAPVGRMGTPGVGGEAPDPNATP